MAVGYRDATSNYVNSGTTLDVTLPGTIVAGDLILLSVAARDLTSGDPSPSGGGGSWAPVGGGPVDDVNLRTLLYSRVANAGDIGATVTLSWSVSSKVGAIVWVGSGADPASPVNQVATAVEAGTDTTHDAPGVTPATAGCWVVEFVWDRGDAAATITAPGGRTERREQLGFGTGSVNGICADSNGPVTAGVATGTQTYTWNASFPNAVGWSVAVAPAPDLATRSRVSRAAAVRAATW